MDKKQRFQMLNLMRKNNFSNTQFQSKLKNQQSMFSLASDFKKYKNMSKNRSSNSLTQSHTKNNIFLCAPPNHMTYLSSHPNINTIPTKDIYSFNFENYKPKRTNSVSKDFHSINQKKEEFFHIRNRSANGSMRNINKDIFSLAYSNSNSAGSIPKGNNKSTSVTKLKNEIEMLKKENKRKDDLIRNKMINQVEMEKNYKQIQNDFNLLKSKYNKLKNIYNTTAQENKYLQNLNTKYEREIKYCNEKELKLMQVIFLIKERGIDIDEFVNDVMKMSNSDISERSEISINTVYFPDKIKMENEKEKNVPILNFDCIPSYQSDSDEEDEEGKIEVHQISDTNNKNRGNLNIALKETTKFNKINLAKQYNNKGKPQFNSQIINKKNHNHIQINDLSLNNH